MKNVNTDEKPDETQLGTRLNIGVWDHKKIKNAYRDIDIIRSDEDINALFEASVNDDVLDKEN